MGAGKVIGGVLAAVVVCGVAYVALVKKDIPSNWVESQNKQMQNQVFLDTGDDVTVFDMKYKKISIVYDKYTYSDNTETHDTDDSYNYTFAKSGSSIADYQLTITNNDTKEYAKYYVTASKYYVESKTENENSTKELTEDEFTVSVGLSHIVFASFLDFSDNRFLNVDYISTNLVSNQQQLLTLYANCKKDNTQVTFGYSLLSKKITSYSSVVESYTLNKLTEKTTTKVSISY